MSVFLLSKGEKISILCPAHYANGGASVYAHFDHEQIPAQTDMKYKIEILECESNLTNFNKVNEKYKLAPWQLKNMDEKIV